MQKNINTYYYEWLSLSKEEFMILDLLVEEIKFIGNLSDICRKMNLVATHRSRAKFKNAISSLFEHQFIKCEKKGRTYILELSPTEEMIGIEIEKTWVSLERLRKGHYSESVHWVNVLKVLLYLKYSQDFIFTNQEISDQLGISTTTVISSKKVLHDDFNALDIDYQYAPKTSPEDEIRCVGQKAEFNALTKIPDYK